MKRSGWAWIAFSAILHGGIGAIALQLEPPPPPQKVEKEKDPLAQVRIQNQKVELPKPPPPKVEKKEAPKPEPPPEKTAEAPKPVEKKKSPPKKRKKKRRAVVKKKTKAPVPQKAPVVKTAAPLVLSNVSLGGGIAVAQGDEDIFGDPDESRKGVRKAAPVKAEPVAPEDTGPPKKSVVVPPKPSSSNPKQVPWPPDVPKRSEKFKVKLSLRINDQGRVSRVTIVSGKGEPFDTAARKFARKLRFKPATRDGKPIPYSVPWELCWNCSG